MFVYAREIARSRQQALDHWLGLGHQCIDAGLRLNASLSEQRQHSFALAPLDWHAEAQQQMLLGHLSQHGKQWAKLLEIAGDFQQALIQHFEAQVRAADQLGYALIEHLRQQSPWEARLALDAVESSLNAAESSLAGVSAAALESIAQAEQETQELVAQIAPAPRSRGRKSAS